MIVITNKMKNNMEATDKGTLRIEMDNECRKSVVFNPVNGTVWMSKCELIELFDVYRQTIDACIQGIIKANTFDMETVCKCDLTQRGNRIEYIPYEFSLEFIIAMAFRIKSENAKLLRGWFLRDVLRPKVVFVQVPMSKQNHLWN